MPSLGPPPPLNNHRLIACHAQCYRRWRCPAHRWCARRVGWFGVDGCAALVDRRPASRLGAGHTAARGPVGRLGDLNKGSEKVLLVKTLGSPPGAPRRITTAPPHQHWPAHSATTTPSRWARASPGGAPPCKPPAAGLGSCVGLLAYLPYPRVARLELAAAVIFVSQKQG